MNSVILYTDFSSNSLRLKLLSTSGNTDLDNAYITIVTKPTLLVPSCFKPYANHASRSLSKLEPLPLLSQPALPKCFPYEVVAMAQRDWVRQTNHHLGLVLE